MTEETIFAVALEKPPAERAAFLAGVCGDDTALRKRLEGLLAASDQAGNFMARPAVASASRPESATELVDSGSTPHEAAVTLDGPRHEADEQAEDLAFLSPSTRPDSLGRIGHYEVLEVLGRGGFGIVFRAFDDVLQRVVAIKVMAPQLAATSPARKRFLREARTSAAVRHENVVQVYEVAEQPLPYLAMEFIPGETLQQRLDRTGPLDVSEVLRIGRQIAEGLAAAHATDLIHRDIKPSNILIESGQQRVKLTDFGLARAADDASISQSGIIAGTPMYMAPEQALGHKLDQRADLFSLGSVLYQMASGRPPFRANTTVAVLKRVAEDTPRDIREIIPETPQWLCNIIAKLHAKNPDERYQSAREVADVLADCEQQLKANSKLKDFSRIPVTNTKLTPRTFRIKRAAIAASLLAIVALAIVAFAFKEPILLYTSNRGELVLDNVDPDFAVTIVQNGNVIHDRSGQRTFQLPADGATEIRVVKATTGAEIFRTDVAVKRGERVQVNIGQELAAAEERHRREVRGDLAKLGKAANELGDDGWVQLFNGKDLTGWNTYKDAPGEWGVENGVLVGNGPVSYLLSDRADFENFHLRAEVKIHDDGDRGYGRVSFRCGTDDLPVARGSVKSLEVEIRRTGLNTLHTIAILVPSDGGLNAQISKVLTVPVDNWFTLDFTVRDDQIILKVNGESTLDEGTFVIPKRLQPKGSIVLQVHTPNVTSRTSVIHFRKIEIKELPATPKSPEQIAADELAKLNGEWVGRQGRVDQEALVGQAIAGMKLTLANGKFVLPIRDDSGYPWALTGIYTVDAAKKQLAFKFNHGPLDTPAVVCTYRIEGDKLVLDFPEPKSGERGAGTELFVPDQRITSQRNLRNLGVAMHGYMAANKDALPPAAITNPKDGKPLLSWRVALLPHLELGELYKQFKLDEPWDSEHNKKLIDKMPKVFAIPGTSPPPGHTHYRVFVGPGTAFEPREKGLGIADFLDGTASTILVVEAADPVIWTKPDDLPYDPKKPLPKLGVYKDGAHLLMGDGSVWRLSPSATEKGIRGAIDRDGGEVISPQLLRRIPWRGPALYLELQRRAAPQALTPLDREDFAKLKGTWSLSAAEVEAKPVELKPTDLVEFVLGDFDLDVRRPGGKVPEAKGTFRIDAAHKEVLLYFEGNPVPVRCSYRFDGNRLRLTMPGGALGGKAMAARTQSANNLKQLAVVMHIYCDVFGGFPRAAIEKDGKLLLSWRVAILPYIAQDKLYRQFKLDEPWDSEHNKKLIDKMPAIFATPGSSAKEPGMTNYRVFVGPGTAFEPIAGRKHGVRPNEIPDGVAKTLLIAEAADAVIWTKPDELPFDPKKPLPKLGASGVGIAVAMCDGSVLTLPPDVDEKALRALITRDGDERLPIPTFVSPPTKDPPLTLVFDRVADAPPPAVVPFDAGKGK